MHVHMQTHTHTHTHTEAYTDTCMHACTHTRLQAVNHPNTSTNQNIMINISLENPGAMLPSQAKACMAMERKTD